MRHCSRLVLQKNSIIDRFSYCSCLYFFLHWIGLLLHEGSKIPRSRIICVFDYVWASTRSPSTSAGHASVVFSSRWRRKFQPGVSSWSFITKSDHHSVSIHWVPALHQWCIHSESVLIADASGKTGIQSFIRFIWAGLLSSLLPYKIACRIVNTQHSSIHIITLSYSNQSALAKPSYSEHSKQFSTCM